MDHTIVGTSLPVEIRLDTLEHALQVIVADGFDAVELNLLACPLMAEGTVLEPVADFMAETLGRYPLRYTAHVDYGTDLRDLQDQKLHRSVLFSSIDACARLGLGPLNIHYGAFSQSPGQKQAFLDNLRAACDYGYLREVAVNVENADAEDVRYTLDAISKLGHQNCGMTVDLGHLYLSAQHFGYDFIKAMSECIPLARHIHINDNFGTCAPMPDHQPQCNAATPASRLAYSRGDIHLPPFWGSVPIVECFSLLKQAGYGGVWMCEYHSHLFHPLNRKIQERVRKEIQEA